MYFYSQFIFFSRARTYLRITCCIAAFGFLNFSFLCPHPLNLQQSSFFLSFLVLNFENPDHLQNTPILDLPDCFPLVSFPLFLYPLNSYKMDVRSRIWIRSMLHICDGEAVWMVCHIASHQEANHVPLLVRLFDYLLMGVIAVLSHVNQ